MEAEVTFYEGEKWQYEARLAVYDEYFEEEGGEEMVEEYMSELQTEIQKEAPGVQINLQRVQGGGDQVVYRLNVEGEEWDKLTSVSDAIITQVGKEVHIRYPVSYISDFEISSITFKGNKIISSNADVTTNGSATWHNPAGTLEAVLVPKRGISWIPIVFALAIVVMGILMYRSLRWM